MAQVKAEQRHRQDVEAGHQGHLESRDHHSVNIVPALGVAQGDKILAGEIDRLRLHGEVEHMINHKRGDDHTAQQHRARGVTGDGRMPVRVGHGPRRPVFGRNFHGGPDMQRGHHQQSESRRPENFLVGLQKVPVTIDDFRAEKKLEVAQQMPDHEEKQRAARDGHDVFFAE